MQAIQTTELTKKYKDVLAVDRLNLTVHQGELFALLGVNGAGKTTAIRMLTGLTKPDAGDAQLLGKSILTDLSQIKKFIGVSPQETAIAPNLTVRENLELICGAHGFAKEKKRERTLALLQQFRLQPIQDKKAGKLSGGWQRKLSLAMALIIEPQILFLDEPTLGLDVLARSELWELIRAMKGETTVILTTHYLEEAETLADRVGIMKDGRLLAVGTVSALKQRAGTDHFEKAFISIVKEEDSV